MTSAEDVERQLEVARFAILRARACWAHWVAPPPDLECTLTNEEYVKRAAIEQHAANAEYAMWDALRLIREQYLGIRQEPLEEPPAPGE
jgi:hypothetical protein